MPFQILMIPVRNLTIAIGIYDTRWALILFHAAFQTGFCTLFMRNFIKQLPDDMLDAARNEGLSELQIFWHIVLPLVRPAIAAHRGADLHVRLERLLLGAGAGAVGRRAARSPRGCSRCAACGSPSWHLISAGSIVAAIPPVLIFFLMQRHFIAGLTSGTQSD